MQITEQDNARCPANLDLIALDTASQIMAVVKDDPPRPDAQIKARIQVLVRDALDVHTPAGTAVYWHQRFQEAQAQAEELRTLMATMKDQAERDGYQPCNGWNK